MSRSGRRPLAVRGCHRLRDIAAIVLLHALLAGAADAQRVEDAHAYRLASPTDTAAAMNAFARTSPGVSTRSTIGAPVRMDHLGLALWGLSVGAGFGIGVDQAVCERRHAGEPVFLFSPCFLYFGRGTAHGTIIGSSVGATAVLARHAQRRGCSGRAAWLRAAGGAALGALPAFW